MIHVNTNSPAVSKYGDSLIFIKFYDPLQSRDYAFFKIQQMLPPSINN